MHFSKIPAVWPLAAAAAAAQLAAEPQPQTGYGLPQNLKKSVTETGIETGTESQKALFFTITGQNSYVRNTLLLTYLLCSKVEKTYLLKIFIK